MNKEQILSMDTHILLSVINMKLRDEFSSLKDLCSSYEVNTKEIEEKLKIIGYGYNESTNQFTSV